MPDREPLSTAVGGRSYLTEYCVIAAMVMTIASQVMRLVDPDADTGPLNVMLLLGCLCVLLVGATRIIRGRRGSNVRR